MPTSARNEKPSKQRYVLVILRLLLDDENQLVQGEVLDEEGRRQRRFRHWHNLTTILPSWLATQQAGGSSQQS